MFGSRASTRTHPAPEAVRGILIDTTEIVDSHGRRQPAVELTMISDGGADGSEGRRRFVVDLEILRHLEALLPDLLLEAQEELNVRRAKGL